ncbi:unnamed protein product [Calypogeia fissa]
MKGDGAKDHDGAVKQGELELDVHDVSDGEDVLPYDIAPKPYRPRNDTKRLKEEHRRREGARKGRGKALKSSKALATPPTKKKLTVVIAPVGDGVDKISVKNVDVARKRKGKSMCVDDTTHQDSFSSSSQNGDVDQPTKNIHRAREAAPWQEEEEMVMINHSGVRNHNCPLTGKPMVELENPVRSIQCHHIYEQTAVIEYVAKAGRRRCKCAVAGCPFFLKMDNLKNDASLNMEVQELRLRDRATQLENYTEIEDLEDKVVDLKD